MEIIKSDKAKNHEINGYNLKILEISKHNGQNSKSDFFSSCKAAWSGRAYFSSTLDL